MMSLTIGSKLHSDAKPKQATCALFLPFPLSSEPCTNQDLQVTLKSQPMDVTDVSFYEQPKDEVGLPPKIAIPIDQNIVTVQLIVESKGGNSVICGYILTPEREQSTACRFNNPIKLDDNVNMSDVHVAIEQVSGHPSNDGKMISICTGQCATRCKCFCSACLITLDELNKLPE